jgi:hypothetical protein
MLTLAIDLDVEASLSSAQKFNLTFTQNAPFQVRDYSTFLKPLFCTKHKPLFNAQKHMQNNSGS